MVEEGVVHHAKDWGALVYQAQRCRDRGIRARRSICGCSAAWQRNVVGVLVGWSLQGRV